MSSNIDPLDDPSTLFGRLRTATGEDWRAYTEHVFVQGIADGSLPERCFRHYLVQDYVFLIHFSRAWALAVYKADSLADMRSASSVLHAILDHEMNLHLAYSARWGITEAEMESAVEARANMAYTRYVLERGMAGDVLDLHVALAPCTVGYAVIGRRLAADPATCRHGNPYGDWIAMYSGAQYLDTIRGSIEQLDTLASSRMGEGRFERLAHTFRQATRLEAGFWDMGMELGE